MEKTTEATADSPLESLHQQHLPVSGRRGQPILFLKYINTKCNWGNITQNRAFKSGSAMPIQISNELAITQEMQGNASHSTSTPCGSSSGQERRLWAGGCCSCELPLHKLLGWSCKRCQPRALFKAFCTCSWHRQQGLHTSSWWVLVPSPCHPSAAMGAARRQLPVISPARQGHGRCRLPAPQKAGTSKLMRSVTSSQY